jgi:hypothetical protein
LQPERDEIEEKRQHQQRKTRGKMLWYSSVPKADVAQRHLRDERGDGGALLRRAVTICGS